MKNIYKVIDNLNNNKAPEPGYINAYASALKSGKYAIATHLKISLNDCTQANFFSNNS